jgi:heptosyltransferase-3
MGTEMDVPAPHSIRSILVIQTKFLGDIILTSVLLNALRRQYPQAAITVLCSAGLENFIVNQGLADKAVPLRLKRMRGTTRDRVGELTNAVRTLRRERFDMSIDVADSKTSRIVVRLVNASVRVGYDPPEKPLRYWERLPVDIGVAPHGPGGDHYLHRYLSPLDALGITVTDPVPRLMARKEAMASAIELLGANKIRAGAFVAVHAGASFAGRCWQPERFAETIDAVYLKTGLRSVIVGGPDETGIAEQIMAAATSPVASLVGKVSLETLVAILTCATAFLGNESGPMHMAGAVGTPVVGLFGLTPPAVWGPLGGNAIAIQPPMPCFCINPGMCRPGISGRVYCVQRLDVDVVVRGVLDLLDADARGERQTS